MSLDDSSNLSQITIGQLKLLLAEVYDERFVQKGELEPIKAEINALKNENLTIKAENEKIKNENQDLKKDIILLGDRMVSQENRARKNNLVFGGLAAQSEITCSSYVSKFLSEVLKIPHAPVIVRAFPMGKSNKPPILTEFLRSDDVFMILKNTHVLKNTGYYVQRDFPAEVRAKRSKMLQIKKELSRVNPTLKTSLRDDKLIIQNVIYEWVEERGVLDANGTHAVDQLGRQAGVSMDGFLASFYARNGVMVWQLADNHGNLDCLLGKMISLS
ncbi:hypothetical protein GE061_002188 [Apolygus lucorum]|uniref:Uncharacterized protein n=1 Tax=Apolygus lucorum TaxID=248454 RepID=A0A8S9X4G5_APOLU|nr:hypothetical protein GE061_002188 [Apolygus lucorum]